MICCGTLKLNFAIKAIKTNTVWFVCFLKLLHCFWMGYTTRKLLLAEFWGQVLYNQSYTLLSLHQSTAVVLTVFIYYLKKYLRGKEMKLQHWFKYFLLAR